MFRRQLVVNFSYIPLSQTRSGNHSAVVVRKRVGICRMWYVRQNRCGNRINLGGKEHVAPTVEHRPSTTACARVLVIDGRSESGIREVSVAHRICGHSGCKKSSRAYWVSLISEIKEQLVLQDRAAYTSAKLIPSLRCFLAGALKIIPRLEEVVLIELKQRSMPTVRAALQINVQ